MPICYDCKQPYAISAATVDNGYCDACWENFLKWNDDTEGTYVVVQEDDSEDEEPLEAA